MTALRVGGGGAALTTLLSYADTQYSEETTDKYSEIEKIIYDVRLAMPGQATTKYLSS